jgi:deoxycytidine triphosphate deaminase
MLINPKTAMKEGWISHKDYTTVERWEEANFFSPNAIDFTIDHLYSINTSPFVISEETKRMRGGAPIQPNKHKPGWFAEGIDGENDIWIPRRKDPQNPILDGHFWTLEPKTSYDAMSNFYVNVPEKVAALLIIRSTFNRNGLFMTSGIYDSNFSGHLGFVLHNMGDYAYIAPGTRIGQVMFVESNNAGTYLGGYNTAPGQHWYETDKTE